MSQKYTLLFVNNGTNTGNACIYQNDPDIGVPNVMSLAWFSKQAHPTTRIKFEWTLDYSFMWSETGVLASGVDFEASQVWPADLTSSNKVAFTDENGAYTFENQTSGTPGSLIIVNDGTIPARQASVGIGMSGQGAFVVQAQPNLTQTFTPHPKYFITFGNYEAGEVLDIGSITSPAEIVFPPNVYSMTAILNEDNSWTVKPTREVNALYLQAKSRDPQTRWGDLSALQDKGGKKVATLSR
jgi:hypothetical protein